MVLEYLFHSPNYQVATRLLAITLTFQQEEAGNAKSSPLKPVGKSYLPPSIYSSLVRI
jgi:hypothetical protein